MNMNLRKMDGSDPASRLADIEAMTEAAMQLVNAGQYDLADQVLAQIAERAIGHRTR